MNRIYKTIWNEALGTWVAASEIDSARGKGSASSCTARDADNALQGGKPRGKLSAISIAIGLCVAGVMAFSLPAFAQYQAGGGTAVGSGDVAVDLHGILTHPRQ